MSESEEIRNFIKKVCNDYSLRMESGSKNNFRVFTDHASGISLTLEIKLPATISFYFIQRTYDIVYQGDRSDVHVILSLMFTCFLRTTGPGISCSLFDVPHPVVEDEIWGRYIMPEQTPAYLGLSDRKQLKDAISKLILALVLWRDIFWSTVGCPCQECLNKDNVDTSREYELPQEIQNSANRAIKRSYQINYGGRVRPSWSYLYDMKNEVTIIKSEKLCLYLDSIRKLSNRKLEKVEGINGIFILDGELKNFLHKKSLNELNRVIKSLKLSSKPVHFEVFPFENMIVALAAPYIIGLGRLSGISEFKSQRELLRSRHNKESEVLFPIPLFNWHEDICPDQFERLIKILLEREPNVKTVKRPAPVNQGDKGRDLLIEWNVRNPSIISESQPPTSLIKVVGQCKASNKTVGKNKVLDIRDTVETHNASGYFLAVSSQISEQLTEKLEELQSKGVWTNWWNRDDIETRLSKNQDLIPYFPKVLEASHKVKFVEKESLL